MIALNDQPAHTSNLLPLPATVCPSRALPGIIIYIPVPIKQFNFIVYYIAGSLYQPLQDIALNTFAENLKIMERMLNIWWKLEDKFAL